MPVTQSGPLLGQAPSEKKALALGPAHQELTLRAASTDKRFLERLLPLLSSLVLCLIGSVGNAYAYIGPGPGFVLVSSLLVLVAAVAFALFYLFSWPFRFLLRSVLRPVRGARRKGKTKRVIIIGFDGMDPGLVEKFMERGQLPHFSKLKAEGTFAPLSTTYPSLSPVAWSSFMTGVDPSHHNIFDFITRDPCTYQPLLSSAEIGKASKVLPLGKYMVPLGGARLKLLRKSKPFWKTLGENGVFSSILRVPVTFPPEKFNGVLLSGMCTPDLKGSQGTFSFYTTSREESAIESGGVKHPVTLHDGTIRTYLSGPENTLVRNGSDLKLPLTIRIDREAMKVHVEVSGQKICLQPETYSPWVRLTFRPGLGLKIRGICRFYVSRISPHFELYVSPIHIDPEKPALPISHPFIYSIYLAKSLGPYGTLGLAEDTWALNERVIDEEAFLKQAYLFLEERERMFFKALERTPRGLCACVFDTTDRVQHMFFRCLDPDHPANRGKEVRKYENVIEDLYKRMDELLGKVVEQMDEKTTILVISDHGFCQFRRGVNLNSWLYQNGFLVLSEGRTTSGEWFEHVDWERTQAFSLGLTGIFINRAGRETHGIVREGLEIQNLKRGLTEKLTGLVDEEKGQMAIRRVLDTERAFSGPYRYDAPDLLVGYNAGYRNSWACAVGRVTETVFEDNTKSWSGDHCVDPELVPGVFFSNKRINLDRLHIQDIAPTVLSLFGVEAPSYLKGRPLL